MTAVDLLLTRQSNPKLSAPAPSEQDLITILQAGMRVPDHAGLKPYHFTVAKEDGLQKLSDIFVSAVAKQTDDKAKLDKTAKMPFRAPVIVIVSTKYQVHEKVPNSEQLITAGCCVHAMQMAAVALGYGAMWRTGDLSYNNDVKQALHIDTNEDIAGFLYIGTPEKELPIRPNTLEQTKISWL